MPINIKAINRQVDALMVDEVKIAREDRDADKTLNEITLQYDDPPDIVLYEGKALVSTDGQEPRERPDGGMPSDNTLYRLRIPADPDVPRIRRNDKVVLISSNNSPMIEETVFRIEQELHGTYAVGRRFHMVLVDRVID